MTLEARDLRGRRDGLGAWWFRLSAPAEPVDGAPFHERENVRRAQLASVILLVFMLGWIGFIPVGFANGYQSYPLILLTGLFMFGSLLYLNRRGWVTVVGVFLIVLIDLGFLVFALALPGTLPQRTSIFDILLLGDLISISTLEPGSIFFVALGNLVLVPLAVFGGNSASVLVTGDVRPVIGLIVQPVIMQLMTAIVAYLWASSVLRSLRRADYAEQSALLRKYDDAERRDLEEGLRQLLAAHAALANGNYAIRAPTLKHPVLWQMSNSLNNIAARSSHLAEDEAVLRRVQEDAHRLASALNAIRAGRQPTWPQPSGTPVDEVIEAAKGTMPLVTMSGPLPPHVPLTGQGSISQPGVQPDSSYDFPSWLLPPTGDRSAQGPRGEPRNPANPWNDGEWPDLGGSHGSGRS